MVGYFLGGFFVGVVFVWVSVCLLFEWFDRHRDDGY